jgi:peroxiredoxin
MPGSFEATAPVLHPGQKMPGFALTDTEGNVVRLSSFRQRRPVLIALLHGAACPDCRAWLPTLAAARDELAYQNVQPLLIFPDEPMTLYTLQQEVNPPAKILADPLHTTLTRYLRIEEPALHRPVLLVAVGRYNECLDTWLADEPAHWSPLAQPLALFAFAEQEDCACGLPAWPED